VFVEITRPLNDLSPLITAIATGVIAIYTLTLARVGRDQHTAAMEALGLGRAEFNATHRPKFIVRDVFPEEMGSQLVVRFTVVNVGDATGRLEESSRLVGAQFGNQLFIHPRSFGKREMGVFSLAPGEFKEMVCPYERTIGEVIKTFKPGAWFKDEGDVGSFAYFAGAMVYSDGNGLRRRTVFRRIYSEAHKRYLRDETDTEYDYAD